MRLSFPRRQSIVPKASAFDPSQGTEPGLTVEFAGLERDDFSSNRHAALSFLFEHDLFGKPVPTFPDHALGELHCTDRSAKASTAIKPAINSNEIVATIAFAVGLSFHDRRP